VSRKRCHARGYPSVASSPDPDWSALIQEEMSNRPAPVEAKFFVYRYRTASQPVRLACGDPVAGRRQEYVVKHFNSMQNDMGKLMINEQIIAHSSSARLSVFRRRSRFPKIS
jgi:hypothetical protein